MKNPLIPMIAITGKPTKDEIDNIMQLYADKEIQQCMIYPRSGCEIEYMSEQWIDVCSWIIEFAANNNMHVWIYDEFNWPSGTCRGKVMREHKEYVAKAVYQDLEETTLRSVDIQIRYFLSGEFALYP